MGAANMNNDLKTMEDFVWFYYDLGLKVIPLKSKSKKPNLDSWEEYQTRKPTKEEIEKWLAEGKFGNVGLICGKCSDNLFFYAIDVEDEQNYKRFFYDHETIQQKTIVVRTGGGGYHVWFFSPKPVHLDRKRFHEDADLDIQLDGTYVVAPPSIHPETERPYEFVGTCEKPLLVNDLETKLKDRLRQLGIGNRQVSIKEISKGVSEGAREVSAFRYACFLLNWKDLDENATLRELQEWNSKNNPPLSESELRHAFESALNYLEPSGINVQKTDIVITIGNQEVRILQKRPNTVHPSIDYKNGIAYVGVQLPCEVKGRKGIEYQDAIFLLTSNHDLVYTHDTQQLISNNIILESTPMFVRPRWKVEHVLRYVKSTEKVDPKHVYETIRNQFTQYMEFPHEPYYDFCALWTIGSYFYHIFDAYPYLFINGVKQSGKTKLLNLIYSVSFNAMLSASITPAAIFRSIEALRCTLCIDEQEQLHNVHDEKVQALRSILLSGFMKGGSVQRVAGERNEQLMNFSTYSPKALANIFGIETILEDRCIVLQLLRAMGERKNVEPNLDDPIWYEIRDLLYRLFLDYVGELSELSEQDDGKIEGIEARELKIWRPIFTLARFFEKHGVEGLVEQMKRLVEITHKHRIVSDQTESLDTMLASTLYERVKQDDWYSIKDITNWLYEALGEMPKWLTPHYIGKALTRLGFLEKKHGKGGNVVRLTPSQVKDCAMRMRVENITIYQDDTPASKNSDK